METISFSLRGVVPESEASVNFTRIELLKEGSPLAVVWYTVHDDPIERGVRIDLDKRVFLDDLGQTDRGKLNAAAHLIVNYMFLETTSPRFGTAAY
jgi:hypothetical protein